MEVYSLLIVNTEGTTVSQFHFPNQSLAISNAEIIGNSLALLLKTEFEEVNAEFATREKQEVIKSYSVKGYASMVVLKQWQ